MVEQDGAVCGAEGISRWHWLIFFSLQLLNFYQLMQHAMWRDELQIWSLVRASATIPELIHNMRYDGFPALWYVLLWFISLVTASPVAMQLFHFTCSSAAQFLVMLRSPFSPWMKLTLVAGYYFSFEYCVISRAYVLGVLLVFCYCAFQRWLEQRPYWRIFLLGLLANTSVYGAILSLAFVADELWTVVKDRRSSGELGLQGRKILIALIFIYGALFAAALACMLPPADVKFSNAWRLYPDANELVYQFCRNLVFMVPVPLAKPSFWNTLALIDCNGFVRWMILPIGVVIGGGIWASLYKDRRRLLLFITGFAGIWIFTVVKYYGFVRHIGAEMVLFIACIWLAGQSGSFPPLARRAFWCILFVNLLAWGIASCYHLRYDFSGSRQMAAAIREFGGSKPTVIADEDGPSSSVAGYLAQPLYYASNRKPQTYISWNTERSDGRHDVLGFANELAAAGHVNILLLLNYPMPVASAKLLACTGETIVKDEAFCLYAYVP